MAAAGVGGRGGAGGRGGRLGRAWEAGRQGRAARRQALRGGCGGGHGGVQRGAVGGARGRRMALWGEGLQLRRATAGWRGRRQASVPCTQPCPPTVHVELQGLQGGALGVGALLRCRRHQSTRIQSVRHQPVTASQVRLGLACHPSARQRWGAGAGGDAEPRSGPRRRRPRRCGAGLQARCASPMRARQASLKSHQGTLPDPGGRAQAAEAGARGAHQHACGGRGQRPARQLLTRAGWRRE